MNYRLQLPVVEQTYRISPGLHIRTGVGVGGTGVEVGGTGVGVGVGGGVGGHQNYFPTFPRCAIALWASKIDLACTRFDTITIFTTKLL